jgi:MFS family permease
MAPSERRSNTFAALAVPHYRSYFFGAAVSQTGSWMQTIALGWMVVRLGGGGVELGVMAVLQFSPALVGGMVGGVIADRYDRRTLLIATQTAFAAVAAALTALSALGGARMWSLGLCALIAGCVTTVDNPTRHSLAIELVGPDLVANAPRSTAWRSTRRASSARRSPVW